MAKNKMTDLRNHLFETIEGLMDSENPMDIQRAKAVAGVAQTIINSAKLEVEYLKLTDQLGGGSVFLEEPKPVPATVRPGLPQVTPVQKGLSIGKSLGAQKVNGAA